MIPVFLEEVETDGALGYYLNSLQWLVAYPGPIAEKAETIHAAVRAALSQDAPEETSRSATIDDELVALARSICWDIRMQLNESVSPESVRKVDEPKHGQEVLVADLAAVAAARRSISDWTARSGLAVRLVGEDVEGDTSEVNGATVLDLQGNEFDLPGAANEAITGDRESSPFVAAADSALAGEIVQWLSRDEPLVPSL